MRRPLVHALGRLGEPSAKQKYLLSELWILSWAGSVQRSSLYKKNTENQRGGFKRKVIEFIESKLIRDYCTTVTECQHIKNIQRLSCKGTDLGGALLQDGYRIGVAQKLLNLQLKYLWCLGLVAEPPHCPVDKVIINKTHLKKEQIAWTKITEIKDYKRIISALKKAAQPTSLSLSCWELSIYDRRDAK